jgi:hypothetical protein
MMRWITTLLYSLISLGALAAQERRDYVRFPITKDAEALIKERLQMEKQLGPFKDLVKQILDDPNKFGIDPEMFKDVPLDDPKLKKAVQAWAQSDPTIKKAVKDWVERMPKDQRPDVQKLQKELKQVLDPPTPKPRPVEPNVPIGPKPLEPKEDPLAKVAEKAMEQAERTKVGEWLRGSEAWKQAFRDLRGLGQRPDANGLKDSAWLGKLGITPDKVVSLTDNTLQRLRQLPRPNMERWRWERPVPGLGNLPTPDLTAPRLPTLNSPSWPSLGTAATWLLLLAFLLAAAWQLRRWTGRKRAKDDHRAGLGPWPVRPEAVATRAELVQAFDYLALWSLGLGVKTWNHRAVVERWAELSPSSTSAAHALAALYEIARYTEGEEALPDAVREQARRSLLQLRESF